MTDGNYVSLSSPSLFRCLLSLSIFSSYLPPPFSPSFWVNLSFFSSSFIPKDYIPPPPLPPPFHRLSLLSSLLFSLDAHYVYLPIQFLLLFLLSIAYPSFPSSLPFLTLYRSLLSLSLPLSLIYAIYLISSIYFTIACNPRATPHLSISTIST